MIWLPTLEDVLIVHERMIERTGGDFGIRDIGLIESAIARAQAGYDDYELYSSVEAKAAAIGHGLAANHGFVDGNKRVGTATMLLILRKNGIEISCTEEALVEIGLDIATDRADVDRVTKWILTHKSTI